MIRKFGKITPISFHLRQIPYRLDKQFICTNWEIVQPIILFSNISEIKYSHNTRTKEPMGTFFTSLRILKDKNDNLILLEKSCYNHHILDVYNRNH